MSVHARILSWLLSNRQRRITMAKDSTDLRPNTLHTYLKDSVFVEYFNSFLLLPTFPCHIFYDISTGAFESVHTKQWMDCSDISQQDLLYPSNSGETLFLTDNAFGPVLNPVQSEEWVGVHRLPSFLRSDLYSEYKLCKFLTHSAAPFLKTYIEQAKANTSKRDQTSIKEISTSSERFKSGSCRPKSRRRGKHFSVPAKAEAGDSSSSRPSSSRSLRYAKNPRSARSRSSSVDESGVEYKLSLELKTVETQVKLLTSKSGMGLFRKFLEGKMGERSVLFWLDVEQLKNMENSTSINRCIKEIRDQYFSLGTELELSEDTMNQLGMHEGKVLSFEHLIKCQEVCANRLKSYWYPRFLIHHLTKPSFTLPTLTLQPSSIKSSLPRDEEQEEEKEYIHHPSKSHTPTFRKLPRARSFQLGTVQSVHRINSIPQFGAVKQSTQNQQAPTPDIKSVPLSAVNSTSRLLWSRDSIRGGRTQTLTESDVSKNLCDSMERSSRLAKYNKYPIVHSGRTSVMGVRETSRVVSPFHHVPIEPQILSVSGTPVPLYSDVNYQTSEEFRAFLKCLAVEKRKAGGYFQQYLELLPEKIYINCLFFWREVQEYKSLFMKTHFNPSAVELRAKLLYGKYIVEGSPNSILCPTKVQIVISEHLWPSFEDLFDKVEEFVLNVLLYQWIELCTSDEESFENLQYIEDRTSHIELEKLSEECTSSSSDLESVDSSGVFEREKSFISLSPSELHTSYRSEEGLNISQVESMEEESDGRVRKETHVQVIKKEFTLSNILNDPKELEYFKVFLNNNNGAVHLMCWMEIEAFRALPADDKVLRDMKAKQIRNNFFTKNYFFGPNSPVSKETQREVVSIGGSHKLPSRPKSPIFREAQKHIRARLEKKYVRLFIQTPEFMERNGGVKTTQGDKDGDNERDSYLQYTESHETIMLRKALQNKEQRMLFKYYIRIQASEGMCPANNVEFWLELQRYKEMFHSHMNQKLLQEKMRAIIYCYFQSPSPPRIQVNVPYSMVERILQKPFGPYIFREAQSTVFKHLQYLWNDYQNFIQSHKHKEIEAALKQLEVEIREQRDKMKQDEKFMKLEEERMKLATPRFETIEEKKARIVQMKELKEFGEVAVSFRLSTPNPEYLYCGQIIDLQYKLHPDQLHVAMTTEQCNKDLQESKHVMNLDRKKAYVHFQNPVASYGSKKQATKTRFTSYQSSPITELNKDRKRHTVSLSSNFLKQQQINNIKHARQISVM